MPNRKMEFNQELMVNKGMKKSASTRRRFIKEWVWSFASIMGIAAVAGGCNEHKPPGEGAVSSKAVDECDDLSGVSENDLNARKRLAYVNESPVPDMTCSRCNLFLPPQGDKKCGGCMLFKGPVYAAGYCTYWNAKQG